MLPWPTDSTGETAVSVHGLCRHPEEERLVISVLDKDTLGGDECLGKTAVSLQRFMDGNEHSLDLQLDDSQAPGSIQLKLCYLPLSGGHHRWTSKLSPQHGSSVSAISSKLHLRALLMACPSCQLFQ